MTARSLTAVIALILVAGCAREGELDETGGITARRSSCPAVAIPAESGDVTFFNPPSSRYARAIDVTAAMTNVRVTCADSGPNVVSSTRFDVIARRSDAQGSRTVEIPYFASVIQAGKTIVSKQTGVVRVVFADGQARSTASGSAGAAINRESATLPEAIQRRIGKNRKAGDADAATDPMALPEVKAALSRTSFELLIGFQLTSDQLQYNATR